MCISLCSLFKTACNEWSIWFEKPAKFYCEYGSFLKSYAGKLKWFDKFDSEVSVNSYSPDLYEDETRLLKLLNDPNTRLPDRSVEGTVPDIVYYDPVVASIDIIFCLSFLFSFLIIQQRQLKSVITNITNKKTNLYWITKPSNQLILSNLTTKSVDYYELLVKRFI